MGEPSQTSERWYHGISRYQWLVLLIASLGWVFDVFEGQIFVASMNEAMPDLVPPHERGDIPYFVNITFAAFLFGGALGGVFFGWLSDRIGRVRTMVYTIVIYSACTCLSALSQTWWHMAVCRFLIALGVGGEWAVAAALVAEVFPTRARAQSLAIFHGSSVCGTILAVAAGVLLVGNEALGWRWGFALGAAPALLIIWIRLSLREPARSTAAAVPAGGVLPLFQGSLLRHTLLGVGLATVGLATFWGSHIYGKDMLKGAAQNEPGAELWMTLKNWEMTGMLLTTLGGGLGLLIFGPVAARFGRCRAFLIYHIGGFLAAIVLFQVVAGVAQIMAFLPIFGFLTLGMHAGYAIYFPELFPTALRGTGAGFCFNFGRLLAAPVLFLGGWLQRTGPGHWGLSLQAAATLLSCLYLVGIILLAFAPETKGQELPE